MEDVLFSGGCAKCLGYRKMSGVMCQWVVAMWRVAGEEKLAQTENTDFERKKWRLVAHGNGRHARPGKKLCYVVLSFAVKVLDSGKTALQGSDPHSTIFFPLRVFLNCSRRTAFRGSGPHGAMFFPLSVFLSCSKKTALRGGDPHCTFFFTKHLHCEAKRNVA